MIIIVFYLLHFSIQECDTPVGRLLGFDLLPESVPLYDGVCSQIITETCCSEATLGELQSEIDTYLQYYIDFGAQISNSLVVVYDNYAKYKDKIDVDIDYEGIFDPSDYKKDMLLFNFSQAQESCYDVHFKHLASTYCYGCDANYQEYQQYFEELDSVYLLIDSEACWTIVDQCEQYIDYLNLGSKLAYLTNYYMEENYDKYDALDENQIDLILNNYFGYCGWADANGFDLEESLEIQNVFVDLADKATKAKKRTLEDEYPFRKLLSQDSNHYLFYYRSNELHNYPNSITDFSKSELQMEVPVITYANKINLFIIGIIIQLIMLLNQVDNITAKK